MIVYNKYYKIKRSVLMLIVLILITVVTLILFLITKSSIKLTNLLSGLVAGSVIAIVQFCFLLYEYKVVDKFQELKIEEILLHRDDRLFYQNIIETSRKRIDVMGVTANRFMEDFSRQTDRPETKVLLDALNRGVKVRILVPSIEFLPDDDKNYANNAKSHFERVKSLSSNFEYRYFKHVAAHSIVVIDNKCLLGPCFPNIKSKDTPCVYIDADSKYSEKYLKYFEEEWLNAANEV